MAQGILDIKRRMRSINNTMQITKAMYLVSSAKLRKAKQRVEETRPYYEITTESVKRILSSSKGMNHPFLNKREVKKTVYIVITADRGLAGGYSSNILRLAEHNINKESDSVIVMGSKGRDFFKRKGYNVLDALIGITEDPEFSDARQVGNTVMDLYEKEEIDSIKLIYTKFISAISQEPVMITLLPSEVEETETKSVMDTDSETTSVNLTQIQYEPSPESVIEYLIPKYIQGAIFGGLVEAAASQQGARMTAMESATDNAEEIIEDLDLRYNRARQASITQEISEIVGGAEALN